MPIDQTFFLSTARHTAAPKRNTQPERVVQRRVGADGSIAQSAVGSDGTATSAAKTEQAPNPFELFGGLKWSEAAKQQGKREEARMTSQQHDATQAQRADAQAEAAQLHQDESALQGKEDTARRDAVKAEERALSDALYRQDEQPDDSDMAASNGAGATIAGVEGVSPHSGSTQATASPESDITATRRLAEMVSQICRRLSVRDSRAEFSLHTIMPEFKDTVVAFEQRGNRLVVACTCRNEDDQAWFAEHGNALSKKLAAQLHRPVELVVEKMAAADDAEPGVGAS